MRLLRAITLLLSRTEWRPAPDWTDADGRALATFLSSSTGKRLQRFLTNEIAAANERAAMKATAFECGWACGYRGLYAWFQSLRSSGSSAGEEGAQSERET